LNQKHGVEMGDLLMTCLGGIVLTNLRASDMAGRLSGDKVALYLPETNAAGAQVLADRMLTQVGRVGDDITGIPLSFCASLVQAPEQGDTPAALINRGFELVREAKKQGPGQIVTPTVAAPA
jgi:diguanylate cyclase (GGDEF)-like protein